MRGFCIFIHFCVMIAKCCSRCAALEGRYRHPSEVPSDVYRRHDNCTCTVTYESGRGARSEFMRQNAEQRDRAGFKVTVTRTGGAKCCPWCADRIGRWELKNAPKDVFGVHDNCTCMVVYTNSRGVRSQRLGRSRFVDVPYEPPHRMTAEEAAEKGGFSQPRRLTGGANGGIIRQMANGMRKSPFIPLSDSDKAHLQKEIEAIGADIQHFAFVDNIGSHYSDEEDMVYISSNIFPSNDSSKHPRDLMSERAAIAHEYYGHRANRFTTLEPGAWNDEFRASYLAARNCPGLTDEDRAYLVLDALERAKEAGVTIKYNDFIRGVLYG